MHESDIKFLFGLMLYTGIVVFGSMVLSVIVVESRQRARDVVFTAYEETMCVDIITLEPVSCVGQEINTSYQP